MLPSGGVGLHVLPRSLRSVADVRAARTEETVGHSSRDDGKNRRGWRKSQRYIAEEESGERLGPSAASG